MKKTFISLLLAGFVSGPVAADNVNNVIITSIKTYPTKGVVTYTPEVFNTEGCPSAHANKMALVDWSSNEDNKVLYGALVMAYSSGQEVNIGISGCGPDTYFFGLPKVYRVDMGE